ncbi:phosphotransferase family protein [Halobacillus sp. A5]|uniref:phosphotransferase family protein n=1 Tax=Halobacillus sp. A5 TaxID=2880263 RepID=UPI0020A6C014|nr:phosphotransferase [Halobacillus sp. A5]MCP3029189.1 phosphotransferase [Halobacillus sp. A5]
MKHYLQLEQKLFVSKDMLFIKFIYILIFKCKPFLPNDFRGKINKIILYIKIFLKSRSKVISLPLKGDIALKVSDINYKVISLRIKTVSFLYEKQYSNLVENQFYLSKLQSMVHVINWDEENRILNELYINGMHPTASSLLNNHNSIKNLMENLINSSEVKEIKTEDYINYLFNQIRKELKTNTIYITDAQKKKINDYCYQTYKKLIDELTLKKVPQVISHGDVSCKNVIIKDGGFHLIDWEYCNFRSPYFDINFLINTLLDDDSRYSKEINDVKTFKKSILQNLNCRRDIFDFFQVDIYILECLFMMEYILLVLNQIKYRDFAKDINKYIIEKINIE